MPPTKPTGRSHPRSSPDPNSNFITPPIATQGSFHGSLQRRRRPSQAQTTALAKPKFSSIPFSSMIVSSMASSLPRDSPLMTPEYTPLVASSSVQTSPEPFPFLGREVDQQFPPTP
ncbi:hypothetical protein PG995_005449 [Apiospora arundinis]